MIDVREIDIVRGKRRILRKVSLAIFPSNFTVVLGMNGAGKSTLLGAIAGKSVLDKGRIIWDEEDLHSISLRTLAEKRAVLSQNFSPGFPMKVYELVEMGCYPVKRKWSNTEKENRIEKALVEVGMEDFRYRDFFSLSGGEQKRVLLAKCLVQLDGDGEDQAHKYLFLDEPTASIDIKHSYKILQLVKQLTREKKIGVFAILHDLNLAAQFADHVIILKEGHIACQGSPRQVFKTSHIEYSLGIKSIIQEHPIFGCPHITTLPS